MCRAWHHSVQVEVRAIAKLDPGVADEMRLQAASWAAKTQTRARMKGGDWLTATPASWKVQGYISTRKRLLLARHEKLGGG
jgi:hypothetical protein